MSDAAALPDKIKRADRNIYKKALCGNTAQKNMPFIETACFASS